MCQFIFTIIILGLIGNMIAEAFAGNPSVVNFAMFTAVFGLLSLLYLTLASFTEKFIIHPILLVVVDALNSFFFFVAGVALAAELGVESCGNEVCPSYFTSYVLMTAPNVHVTNSINISTNFHCYCYNIVLRPRQRRHQRLHRSRETLSGGPGRHRLHLVQLGPLHRNDGDELPGLEKRWWW